MESVIAASRRLSVQALVASWMFDGDRIKIRGLSPSRRVYDFFFWLACFIFPLFFLISWFCFYITKPKGKLLRKKKLNADTYKCQL